MAFTTSHKTLGIGLWAGLRNQPSRDMLQDYYISYLSDAVSTFESAIERLKQCDHIQCNIPEAIDTAHRIKGNAAMYDYPDLGIKAGEVEAILRSASNETDHASALLSIITLLDDINDICFGGSKSEPMAPNQTLAVETKEPASVTQSTLATKLGRKSIILAFNDVWLCELMASLLEPQFHVICLNSGKAVLNLVKSHKPDFMILEDTLDDLSGLDLLKDFKMSMELNQLPVFIAFTPGSNEAIAEAISLGMTGFSADKYEILEITTFAKDFLEKPSQSILIVDDDPVVRDLLKHTLKSAGYNVDMACDGLEALAYLSETEPDLVLLDRFMPRLEGGTVLYEIQNKINLKSIPVLILTAMVNDGEAKSWFERGAADFIPKPFDPEEVLMRVKQHLETRHRKKWQN